MILTDLHGALGQLEYLETLPQDWDGLDGKAPTKAALDVSEQLIRRIASRYETLPRDIAPLPRGGVEIDWQNRQHHVDVEVGPDGDLRVLYKEDIASGRIYHDMHEVGSDQLVYDVGVVLF